MFVTLKAAVVVSVAVGGLATGVAGASPPHTDDVVQRVTAAASEEQQLHSAIATLAGTERRLEEALAARPGRGTRGRGHDRDPHDGGAATGTTADRRAAGCIHPVPGRGPVRWFPPDGAGAVGDRRRPGGRRHHHRDRPGAGRTTADPAVGHRVDDDHVDVDHHDHRRPDHDHDHQAGAPRGRQR